MKKLPNWDSLFFDFVEKNRKKQFEWGKWDCCLFADACIKEITGESLIPKELKWKNKKTALEAIKSYGGSLKKSIEKACKAKKVKSIHKNFCTTGDLVVFKEKSELVGMSDGFNVLSPSDDGLEVKNDVKILKVFRFDG